MIDIGGGTIPALGCVNLDPHHGVGEWRRRVQDGIPAADASVVAVRASHVMEHIPAGDERIFVMNEVHRVLVPGGTFEIIVPTVGAGGVLHGGWQAFADPTHVSFWYYPESWLYFCEGVFKPNADYGYRIWQALRDEDMELRDGWEARVVLRK
jgi:SAM-dependent methyltransferase